MKQQGFLSIKVFVTLFLIFFIFVLLLYKASQLYNLKRMVDRFQEDREMTPFVESIEQKIQVIDSSSYGDNVVTTCFRNGRQNYNLQLNHLCRKQGRKENCSLWSLNLENLKDLSTELDKTITNCFKLTITPLVSPQ